MYIFLILCGVLIYPAIIYRIAGCPSVRPRVFDQLLHSTVVQYSLRILRSITFVISGMTFRGATLAAEIVELSLR